MRKIIFQPWVGKDSQIAKTKLLILGESHYCDQGDSCCFQIKDAPKCTNFTKEVIGRFVKYLEYKETNSGHVKFEPWFRTFLKFANILHGRGITAREQINFWESLTFFNYIQTALSGPRRSPQIEEFSSSYESFLEFIDNYPTDKIIILGLRLWNNIPKENFEIIGDNKIFSYKNYRIPVKVIYHPSSLWFSYKFSDELKAFVNS